VFGGGRALGVVGKTVGRVGGRVEGMIASIADLSGRAAGSSSAGRKRISRKEGVGKGNRACATTYSKLLNEAFSSYCELSSLNVSWYNEIQSRTTLIKNFVLCELKYVIRLWKGW